MHATALYITTAKQYLIITSILIISRYFDRVSEHDIN